MWRPSRGCRLLSGAHFGRGIEFIPREPFKFGRGPETPSTSRWRWSSGRAVCLSGRASTTRRCCSRDCTATRSDAVACCSSGRAWRSTSGEGSGPGGHERAADAYHAGAFGGDAVRRPEVAAFRAALAESGSWVSTQRNVAQASAGSCSQGRACHDRAAVRGSRLIDASHPSSTTLDFAPSERRDSALALLRFADLGIDDVQIVEDEDEDTRMSAPPRRQLRLMHRVAGPRGALRPRRRIGGNPDVVRPHRADAQRASSGQVLLFDEIDASLHPRLSARLLELFQDPETNPHGAQLIFTTHDTSLLNQLNRDEVWLTEKGRGRRQHLTALAEYGGDKVRRSLNLERAYLQGQVRRCSRA